MADPPDAQLANVAESINPPLGFKIDNTVNKRRFVDAFVSIGRESEKINKGDMVVAQTDDEITSGQKVLAYRFLLGKDDEQYLQLGMRLLWTGASDGDGWLPEKDAFSKELRARSSQQAQDQMRSELTNRITDITSEIMALTNQAGARPEAAVDPARAALQGEQGREYRSKIEKLETLRRALQVKMDALKTAIVSIDGEDVAHFAEKRVGVWKDVLRDAAISTDKMYAFVELMAGYMGEEATAVLTGEDPHAAELSRIAKQQRAEISKRVSALQSDMIKVIVESVMKQSSLQAAHDNRFGSTEEDPLVVVDGDLKKQIQDLASGESGRPFFEANVALRNVITAGDKKGIGMMKLAKEVSKVSEILRESLVDELASHLRDRSGGVELASLPRNSYHIKLRPDAVAAIRTAHDRMTTEMGGRRVPLWVLVEGKDQSLTTKFAQFCGQILTHIRISSGPTSVYISLQKANANVVNLKISLQRLVSHAVSTSAVDVPHLEPNEESVIAVLNARRSYFSTPATISTQRGGAIMGIPVRKVGQRTFDSEGNVTNYIRVGSNTEGWGRYPQQTPRRVWY